MSWNCFDGINPALGFFQHDVWDFSIGLTNVLKYGIYARARINREVAHWRKSYNVATLARHLVLAYDVCYNVSKPIFIGT